MKTGEETPYIRSSNFLAATQGFPTPNATGLGRADGQHAGRGCYSEHVHLHTAAWGEYDHLSKGPQLRTITTENQTGTRMPLNILNDFTASSING